MALDRETGLPGRVLQGVSREAVRHGITAMRKCRKREVLNFASAASK